MREIKFRAWVKSEKRMITDTQEFIPLIVTNKGVIKLQPQFKEKFYEILPEGWFELMQYTGLKDKNGVEIYEGDIIQIKIYDYDFKTRVEWCDITFGFSIQISENEWTDLSYLNNFQYEKDKENFSFEVVGNIHESYLERG